MALRTKQPQITGRESAEQVTAQDRSKLAETINVLILKAIDDAGFSNRDAVDVCYSAARMVAARIGERKKS